MYNLVYLTCVSIVLFCSLIPRLLPSPFVCNYCMTFELSLPLGTRLDYCVQVCTGLMCALVIQVYTYTYKFVGFRLYVTESQPVSG